MRGGIARWKRGVASQGVKQAIDYAFGGSCDSYLREIGGAAAAAAYGEASVTRYVVTDGVIVADLLDRDELREWVSGADPKSGVHRGRELPSPDADLVLDATINAPKSFSLAAMIDPTLGAEFDALQDRLRARIVLLWQGEMNARRGAGGAIRERLSRIEVVELQHERSRALDPHKHRHLWLNMRVQGVDGRWSNIDSRVALKFQTVLNAEGDLAARTDPEWLAALAARGLSLDIDGEIAQLKHLVRPLSRRSNQIEANRAGKLAEWRAGHPGQEPDHVVLTSIDRWSWAAGRPDKPAEVNEDSWANLVRSEIGAIDRHILQKRRTSVKIAVVDIAALDRDLFAARAVADADKRAAGTGGRYSRFDVRAGVVRAVAASGVVADRGVLTELIEDVSERAIRGGSVDVLDGEVDVPAHVKHFMAIDTVVLKGELADRFDRLTVAGVMVPREVVEEIAGRTLGEGRRLGMGQQDAAAAIAGTDRLVTVTGPAGTGKTTMLKVAKQTLSNQGRQMIIVAPTKKAASVAGRETGTAASSLHALLVDHGFRYGTDTAGHQVWSRLTVGDPIPGTGHAYLGPRRYPLGRGDRIVVDEAGMVELHTARALAVVAEETGAGIAMVGDHLQAMPVGHSGAMALMKQRSTATVELTAVHRFKDPAYADLSLRLREPGSEEAADAVARDLVDGGHVVLAANENAVREHMLQRYFEYTGHGKSIALVTGSNADAQAINEAIQAERIKRGQIRSTSVANGQGEQLIHVGDVVQTRRNDTDAKVENRAMWTVHRIHRNRIELASVEQSADRRTVDRDYFAAHVHLAYASTVHGIQGETADAAIVGPGVDASGLYVGMTRGRRHNEAVVVAGTVERAREELVFTMRRGLPEVTVDESKHAARVELGRAARTPADQEQTLASWEDVKRRPLGHVVDVPGHVGHVAVQRPLLHKQLSTVSDQLTRDRRTLRELEVRLTKRQALNHQAEGSGLPSNPVDDLVATRVKLQVRIEQCAERRATLTKDYGRISTVLQQADIEISVRGKLPPDVAAVEERARTERIRTIRRETPTGPLSTPETNGRGLSL